MIYILYIVLALGVVWFFLNLYPSPQRTVSVFGKEIREKTPAFGGILRLFVPINSLIIKFLGRREELKNNLDFLRSKLSPEEFLATKQLLVVIFPLVLFVIGIKNLWILLIFSLFGFLLPDFILNSRIRKRKNAIIRFLPETIELLNLCVGAGLDFMSAVRWLVDKVKINPMIEELRIILEEINIGKSRTEALRDMSKRVNVPDVASFTRTLIQADRMGTPVEEAFKILSEDIRMRRFYRGERQARVAPIKMLFPLIFFILPVIFIIVAGPIIVRFTQEGLFKGITPTQTTPFKD